MPRSVYSSPLWFGMGICIALLTIGIIIYTRMWKRPAIFAMHLSLIIIIAGGILSASIGKRGFIHLVPGQETSTFVTEEGKVLSLPTRIKLISFDTDYYEGTALPRDFSTVLETYDGKRIRSSVNRPGRLRGALILQFSYSGDGGCELMYVNDIIGISVTLAGYILFIICGGWLIIRRRTERQVRMAKSLLTIWIAVAALTAISIFIMHRSFLATTPLPVLNTPWFTIHVSIVIAGYIVLAMATISSVFGMIWSRHSESAQMISRRLLLPGVYLLGVGIIAGAVWAIVSWGRYWAWDPKETWALVTFLLYVIPLHLQSDSRGRTRIYYLYMILALCSMVMTYFGVNMLDSLHSYN